MVCVCGEREREREREFEVRRQMVAQSLAARDRVTGGPDSCPVGRFVTGWQVACRDTGYLHFFEFFCKLSHLGGKFFLVCLCTGMEVSV